MIPSETMRAGAAATAPGSAGVKAGRSTPPSSPSDAHSQSLSGRSDSGLTFPIFEQEHDRFVWRIQMLNWNGQDRLQFWPWFQPKDGGELRPCSAKFGTGGFAVPLERLDELIQALIDLKVG